MGAALFVQVHHANRQRQQREILTLPLTVQGDEATRFQVFCAVETAALVLEIIQQVFKTPFPVLEAQHHQKVIPADVPDKVPARINAIIQALRQAQQHFITPGVTVDVVEGFEAVDVHVTDHRLTALLQQAGQALLDRHVAGQQGERVGVTRLLDLHLGNQLEHIDHPTQPQVSAVGGNDEILFDALPGTTGQQAADLLQ